MKYFFRNFFFYDNDINKIYMPINKVERCKGTESKLKCNKMTLR